MSLINDALQDLAVRNQVPADLMVHDEDVLSPRRNRFTHKLLPFIAGMAAMGCATALVFYRVADSNGDAVAVVSGSMGPSINHAKARENKTEEPSSFALAQTNDRRSQDKIGFNLFQQKEEYSLLLGNEKNSSNDNDLHVAASKTHQQVSQEYDELASLLAQAEASLRRNRLSLPSGDNALSYLRQALTIDENNPQALDLLFQVKQSYRRQLESSLENKDDKSAQKLLRRAEMFGLSVSEREDFAERLKEISHEQVAVLGFANTKVDVTSRLASANEVSAEIKTKPQFSISAHQQDRSMHAKAQDLLKLEGSLASRKVLHNFLLASPDAFHSRILFADLAFSDNDIAAVKAALAMTSVSNPAFSYIKARLLVLEAGELSAISLLEQKQRGAGLNSYEKGFLAGLCQKLGQEEKAFGLYQQLVHENPDELRFLLGYAITADAIGKRAQSIAAYLAVLEKHHPNEKVQAFIKSRLAQLEGKKIAEAGPW